MVSSAILCYIYRDSEVDCITLCELYACVGLDEWFSRS